MVLQQYFSNKISSMTYYRHSLLLLSITLFNHLAQSQNSVGIGTSDSNENAVLELVSPDNNQGFLVPRLTTLQRTDMVANLSGEDAGLMVYDSDQSLFYFWQGSGWTTIDTQLSLTAGTGIDISEGTINNTGDDDNDATNELQDLSLNGTIIEISNGDNVDIGPIIPPGGTDDQNLVLTDNVLTIEDGTGSVNLANYIDDADADDTNEFQTITRDAGTTITLSNGGGTISIADNDNDNSNEIQNISTNDSPGNIAISGGATLNLNVNDGDADDSNEFQDLSLDSDILSLSGSTETIDLGSYLDNTDNQDLSSSASGTTRTISISGGNSTDINVADNDNDNSNEIQNISTNDSPGNIAISGGASLNLNVNDGDSDDSNEFQDLSLDSDILSLSGSTETIDLGSYLDNTDNQDLFSSASGTTRTIGISGGNSTDIDIADNDNNSANEIQNISTNNTPGNIAISGGATLNLNVNDGDSDDANEFQDLSLDSDILSLSGSTETIDLGSYLDNTDNQDLSSSASGTTRTISISGGSSTDINIADNDNNSSNEIQNISTNNTPGNIAISGGATLNLNVNDGDSDDSNEFQDLSLDSDVLSLSGSTETIDLGSYLDNTDSQDLSSSVSGTTRTINISGGNSTIISVADNDNSSSNEIQTVSESGGTVTLSGGGGSFSIFDFNPSAFKATSSKGQALGDGIIRLDFDREIYDITGNDYEQETSEFKVQEDGYYHLSGLIPFDADGRPNGAIITIRDVNRGDIFYQQSSDANPNSVSFSVDMFLTKEMVIGVFIEVSGSNVQTDQSPSQSTYFFSGRRFN